MTPRQLITEFLAEVLEDLLLARMMAQTRIEGIGGRVLFAAAMGVAVCV